MPDLYSYPGSIVLINKLGITDHDRWKAVETAAIGPARLGLGETTAVHPFRDVNTRSQHVIFRISQIASSPAIHTLDRDLDAARQRRSAL